MGDAAALLISDFHLDRVDDPVTGIDTRILRKRGGRRVIAQNHVSAGLDRRRARAAGLAGGPEGCERGAPPAPATGAKKGYRQMSHETDRTDGPPDTLIESATPTRADLDRLARTAGRVTFRGCVFDELDLGHLDVTDWRFETCSLARARLTGARFGDSAFVNCRAPGATFAGAALADTVVEGGSYANASFVEARLSSVRFARCKMTGADLGSVAALDVTFEEVLLVLSVLPGFSFRKAHLSGLDLSEADLRRCDFREAVLNDCSLRDANIADCRFQGADLRGADLGGLRLTEADRFRGAIISKRQAGDLLGQLGLHVL
ncbi:pentapeptide repeat-containing protein [Wenxinia marina]|uniref:Putative low-complexity protein n=1 Tax=Wenxinia marina DSM 24838 TaxID=1123501 RepID=A0A0D0PFZ2_9RHOB|nr:pentapeptide repeat-containing protein [Wenxinia marina]KIQ70231.1 putative low-complexity protein [Wenxinia marina DSM 24838]GGL50219.1 hypothetical protein GCM10011392_00610 [Wenxinia marina]